MYCNHCGKEIANDSQYCNYCGKEISINKKADKNITNNISDKDNGIAKPIAFIIISLILTIFLPLTILQYTGKLDTEITEEDFSTTESISLTSAIITITPHTDIKECNVKLVIRNNSGKLIFADTITKENLKTDYSYAFKFDYNLDTTISAQNAKYYVTGTK